MSSYDLRISIERYPESKSMTCSWGCPDLNLMGYTSLEELLMDIREQLNNMMGKKIENKKQEDGDGK